MKKMPINNSGIVASLRSCRSRCPALHPVPGAPQGHAPLVPGAAGVWQVASEVLGVRSPCP